MKQRIYWIDNLKGFILLLVCFSHFGLFTDICDYLKGARMTTFFFLSGLLFNTQNHPTFKSYWKSKLHSLLIPYFILSFLFALFPFSLKNESIFTTELIYSLNIPLIIKKYINTYVISTIDIIQGYSYIQGTASLWFVYTLFQVSIIYYLISKLSNKHFKFILLITSLYIGWYCNINTLTLPFHLNTMFTSLFFYALGNYCHIYIEREKEREYKNIRILFIIYTLSYFKDGHIDLFSNNLGSSFPIFILYTISGIFLFIEIFKYISKKVI